MSRQMKRREFLIGSGQAALGSALLPRSPSSRGPRSPAEPRDLAPLKPLIAELEEQIPRSMEETRTPGLSIAVIRDGKLVWRRGFGVKDAAAKEPVDNDTVFEV